MIPSFVPGAVNYNGEPADRTKTGGWVSASLIVGIEVCERLATITIATNLVTYLVGTMHLPSATASNALSYFGGTSYLLCFLGGIVSDSLLGQYWSITIFSVINALGTGLLAVVTSLQKFHPSPCNPAFPNTCIEADNFQMGVFYTALYTYSIGFAGVKSSVSPFGANQFDIKNQQEKQQKEDFFNRYFLIINFGSLLAVTVLNYVQDQVGSKWGYGCCSIAMLVAFFVFISGIKRYRYREQEDCPILQILQVLVAAIRKRNIVFPSSERFFFENTPEELRLTTTNNFRFLDKAAMITEEDGGMEEITSSLNPWRLATVTKVEEVKMLCRLMPIWATTIMFWTVYAQIYSFSVQQAATMDRSLGKNFPVPVSSFGVFLIVSGILFLAIYDRLIMPLFRKSKKSKGLTNLQKIGVGLFFSILGMVAAAFVEARRLSVVKEIRGPQATLPISALWLLPQFIFIGIGEAFTCSGQLHFFINESPKGMKAIGTGLFLTTSSMGMFGSVILVEIVKTITRRVSRQIWLAPKINNGRLDYFYGLLGLLSFVNISLFLVCAKKYKVNAGQDKQIGGDVHSSSVESA
ncbi:hypothetical protein SLA2020_012520 [Shorea laevis]